MTRHRTAAMAPLLAAATLLPVGPAHGSNNGGECAFDASGLSHLKVGDSEDKVREVFASGYDATEDSSARTQRRLEVRRTSSGEKLYSFWLSNADRVVFIDIFVACRNADGIGIGTRLGDARKRYGRAKLQPTDTGYFVIFDRLPTLGFMLDKAKLPESLRNLPDDSMSAKAERAILAASSALFAQIRIYPPDEPPDFSRAATVLADRYAALRKGDIEAFAAAHKDARWIKESAFRAQHRKFSKYVIRRQAELQESKDPATPAVYFAVDEYYKGQSHPTRMNFVVGWEDHRWVIAEFNANEPRSPTEKSVEKDAKRVLKSK